MRQRVRAAGWSGALLGVLAAAVLLGAAVGPVAIPPAAVGAVVLEALGLPGADPVPTHRTILMVVRLPRVALGAVVGFALAAAGTVMQGFFRNPMADPSIVGVSSGAAVGAVAVIVLGGGGVGVPLAAFAGALLAAFGVYLLAAHGGRVPVSTLLLTGVAVQTLLGAVVSLLLVVSADSDLREAVFWLMGHLHDSTWGEVAIAGPVAVLGFLVLYAYARELNVLLLGETDATALGVNVATTRRILLAVASVVTGVAVAVAGVIGFVGLIVPHAMRLLVGPDHRVLLPASALAGAAFLVAADTAARAALGGAELPVGIVTAFLGVPFFLYLLRDREVYGL
jgi:iron complex transport system permease protein